MYHIMGQVNSYFKSFVRAIVKCCPPPFNDDIMHELKDIEPHFYATGKCVSKVIKLGYNGQSTMATIMYKSKFGLANDLNMYDRRTVYLTSRKIPPELTCRYRASLWHVLQLNDCIVISYSKDRNVIEPIESFLFFNSQSIDDWTDLWLRNNGIVDNANTVVPVKEHKTHAAHPPLEIINPPVSNVEAPSHVTDDVVEAVPMTDSTNLTDNKNISDDSGEQIWEQYVVASPTLTVQQESVVTLPPHVDLQSIDNTDGFILL